MKRGGFLLLLILLCGCRPRPVVVAGSSCMGRMMGALAESYAVLSGERVEVQLGGTEAGLLALENGGCDLASCSRDPGGLSGVESLAVSLDGIAVAVHRENRLRGLTRAQLRAVFSGAITDWGDLGGAPGPIVTIGREEGSGTRSSFEGMLGLAGGCYDQIHNENGMIRTAVSACPGAIGYLSFEYAGKAGAIRPLAIDGVFPTAETVAAGRYGLTRPLYLCVRAGESRPSVRRFLDFCRSAQGQSVLRTLGLVPAGEEAGR